MPKVSHLRETNFSENLLYDYVGKFLAEISGSFMGTIFQNFRKHNEIQIQ